ncbi:hypothetical protein FDP41_009394 [Naegleria fowleri]|uniref:Uncharacterized protein n=1 Tax=Naegleria fowleri TaxID=5763 RepID=A0A6A5BCV7_NAEFO|nr:uncharacterized protein FDP41_009394 [Naegleria fowleri]KAF0972491.1 hypothetical protein FDP41_009394 [Naegleria fowleri]
MKRLICPLPKIIPLRTDFSKVQWLLHAPVYGVSPLISITRYIHPVLKICENDNSIYDLGYDKLTKYKYNVTKILAGCNENILQHIWTFDKSTVTDGPMKDLTIINIDDNQVSHCGSGVIFVACTDVILVLNGFDGNLLKIIRGFHCLECIELDGNRNLLVCEYYKNHILVTRDGYVIMKIRRMIDHYVQFLLHDRSSNNMILIYSNKLYPKFDVIQILSPNGRVVLERKIDFCASVLV